MKEYLIQFRWEDAMYSGESSLILEAETGKKAYDFLLKESKKNNPSISVELIDIHAI